MLKAWRLSIAPILIVIFSVGSSPGQTARVVDRVGVFMKLAYTPILQDQCPETVVR